MESIITDDFTIEEIEAVEQYVYDIEIEDTHNFFANNILVHNSAYYSLDQYARLLECDDINEKIDLIDQFSKQIVEPFIDERCEKLKTYLNCEEQKMVWEREVIAESVIWRAKKNYIMNIWDSEGVRYNTKKLKMTGVEAKKTVVPEWARNKLKDAYAIALDGTEKEMQKFIKETQDYFYTLKISEYSLPRSVNNIMKWYDPNSSDLCISRTPKQVRASIVHNMMLKEIKIKDVNPIKDGDKIRYVELKIPNPTFQLVIGFDTYLPREFGLEEFIDKQLMFEKGFLNPITSILNVINWKPVKKRTVFGNKK